MKKLTLQIFLDQQWCDAAEICFLQPERGHQGATRLDYLAPFVIEHLDHIDASGAVIGSQYPINFNSYDGPHWPALLLDLLPGGEGRRRWADRLGITNNQSAELTLLEHAAANPIGNLRIKEAAESPFHAEAQVPSADGQVIAAHSHPGFSQADIIGKHEHFIEYAYNLGAAVAGATDVQGEAPKFLLVEDIHGRWHAENALADSQIQKHWIVKFPRGKSPVDLKVLCNEARYLEVARDFGLRVGQKLDRQGRVLFIPRFDRQQIPAEPSQGAALQTQRLAVESLYSLAGVAQYGAATSHETLCTALFNYLPSERHMATAVEYIKRDLLNVVMGNTDNHGRNTAIIRERNGAVQLSPLFDFAPMYLDPEGIARVTRWHASRERAGRPNWRAVAEFFAPWVDTSVLLQQLAAIEPLLTTLTASLQAHQVDADIIERCQPAIANNLQLIQQCAP